ncbi:MAG TPA: hypothetical protein VI911_10970 [Patescibacteria group bacterium]|nr:hypothetical protein [Patescibacteria group bacterium]
MAEDQRIIDQVKREKAEFEKTVETEAIQTQKELINQDELLPVTQIGQKNVLNLFKDYYPPEALEHMSIEPAKVEALAGALKTMVRNVIKTSNPIICLAQKCYAAERCPIQKAGVAPTSHSCPIELMLIDQWEYDYIDDLGVDKQSKVEIDLVRDMVESDLIDWRASHELARGGLFDWNAIGMTEDGKPIYRKEEAVAIGIKLKFKARKDRIREDLMATRKMRAKFGLAKTMDPSKFAAALQDRYNAIKKAEIIDEDPIEEMHEEHE